MKTRAIAGIALGFAACGTLDQPHKSGHSLDDGVAPYRLADRVELCFGRARVVDVAPTSGDQGVCRVDQPARACNAHDDCGEREACICGRCTLQLCRFNRDCRPGHQCTGLAPRRCAPICDGGPCEIACQSDAQCASGELCLGGSCKVLACGPGAPACSGGGVCDLQLREATLSAPSALADGSDVILYLELTEAGQSAIVRARSKDGVHFTAEPDVPVIASGRQPSALASASGIELFYVDGDSIQRARSNDGLTFEPATLALAPEAAWEAGRVAAPGALRIGSAIHLFYEGGDGAGIGLAISEDGVAPPVRASDAPLLVPGAVASDRFTVETIGSPAPVAVGGALRLFFAARGREDSAPRTADGGAARVNASIALALAPLPEKIPELALWPHNPVLGGIANLGPLEESEPSVVRAGGEWRLYYASEGRIELATNPPR